MLKISTYTYIDLAKHLLRLCSFGLLTVCLVSAAVAAGLVSDTASNTVIVKAKPKPNDEWREYKTRTLELISGFMPPATPVQFDKYGGWIGKLFTKTGFFYPCKDNGRWWLVDPDGNAFIHQAVVNVTPGKSSAVKAAFAKQYGTPQAWANATAGMLHLYGFNGVGAWSDTKSLSAAAPHLVYTCIWNFMSAFGTSKHLTYERPGHKGYPNDCILVFHPDFPAFCDKLAEQLAATKDDPYLLGHFSDNELPVSEKMLDKSLTLDRSNPDLAYGYEAAQKWLDARKGKCSTIADITDEDRRAFVSYAYDRYFKIVSTAIKRADPNHLYLGSRFFGGEKYMPGIFAAAGKYMDVISVNYYGAWDPDQKLMRNWERWSGGPVIITEWYTKGMDSGCPNNTGAGWIVETQEDRGRFYQNFALGLLESKVCVGWHWFKYMDNDPNDVNTDPSNLDSNKGIVTIAYKPYTPLLERMRAFNEVVYPLTQYIDAKK